MNKLIIKFLFLVLIFTGIIFPQTKKMAVTIDDLPFNRSSLSNEELRMYVSRLLDKIKSQETPVTAFVNEIKLEVKGELDAEIIDVFKMWRDAGVELGNHTYSHPSANKTPIDEYKKDILLGERVTKKILKEVGKKPRFFRHPFLHTGLTIEYRDEIEKFLSEHGYTVAPVTIDNSEWIYCAAYDNAVKSGDEDLRRRIGEEYVEYMKQKIRYFENQTQKLFGRQINQILLIHSNRINSDYYDKLCEMIRGESYEFITIEEALTDEAYKSENTFIKNNGISWLDRWALTQGKKGDFFAGEPRVPKHILDIAGLESE